MTRISRYPVPALNDLPEDMRTRILEVQPNFVFETAQAAIGSMASVLPQYATEKVRLGEAHRFSLGRNVRVAVIDTGLDASHPELAGVAIESFDMPRRELDATERAVRQLGAHQAARSVVVHQRCDTVGLR